MGPPIGGMPMPGIGPVPGSSSGAAVVAPASPVRTVMPGVQAAAAATGPQVAPMPPPVVRAQLEPLQQRLGSGEAWAVHARPGAHPPVLSQRQPCVPAMHVDETPGPLARAPLLAPPMPELEAPPPELP
jgi:hypothetical protein